MRLLDGRALLGPYGSQGRRFEGWSNAFEYVQSLKAATDDVIEQHFHGNYDAEVAGKWDGELEKHRGRLAFEDEHCDTIVDAEANCCCANTLEKKRVQELPDSECFCGGFDTGKRAG